MMGKVLDLNECRRRLTARKGFDPWSRRFGTAFDDNTTIRQLDDVIVKQLIQGGEDSATALYELIMGMKGLGPAVRFHYLQSDSKMSVTDITLFLLDLLRFEAMFRLGWLEDYPALNLPMLDLIEGFTDQFSAARHQSPAVCQSHPRYFEYLAQFEGDRNAFVRKLIPDAIHAFCRLEGDAKR